MLTRRSDRGANSEKLVRVFLPSAPRIACTLAVLLSLFLVSRVSAADLFLTAEPEVYAAIDKLNALGFLPGFLANTRPYSLLAVRAAANPMTRFASPDRFEGDLLRWVLEVTVQEHDHVAGGMVEGGGQRGLVPEIAGYAGVAFAERRVRGKTLPVNVQ